MAPTLPPAMTTRRRAQRHDRVRRHLRRAVWPVLSLTCLGCWMLGVAAPDLPPARPPTRGPARYDDFDTTAALATLHHLTAEIGPRAAGSHGERAAAAYLRGRLRQLGYETRVQSGIPLGPGRGTTRNVIGLRRHPAQARRLLLGAHFDSVAGAGCVGANDNASGVAVTLELARLLATAPLPYSLEVVFFGGEERAGGGGLIGSSAYVAQCAPADLPVAMICVDMVGRGPQLRLWHDGRGGGALAELLARSAARLDLPCSPGREANGSDYGPFAAAGVPAVWVQRLPDACNHTRGDTLDRIEPEALCATGQLLAHALLRVRAEELGLEAPEDARVLGVTSVKKLPQVLATPSDIGARKPRSCDQDVSVLRGLGGFHGCLVRALIRGCAFAAKRVTASHSAEPHPRTQRGRSARAGRGGTA